MADYIATDTDLTSIADAIRTKGSTSAPLEFPSGFVSAVNSISGGGITPTGTKQISISSNGTTTEDVTTYASAEITVSVPSVSPTGTKQITISSNGTTTEDVTNYANAEIAVAVPPSGIAFSKFGSSVSLKNNRTSGVITFNRLSYSTATTIGWGGQANLAVGNTNTYSDYATDGTHIWFRAMGASTVTYNGSAATYSRDTSSAVIMLTIPANYDSTIPFLLA